MDSRKVYFKGRGEMVSALEADMEDFIPRIRAREVEEIQGLNNMDVDEAVRFSYKMSHKKFSYLANGKVLVMAGVADLPRNSTMSGKLGALDGKGGIPFLLSTDDSTEYKFEIARRCAPILFKEIKEGYDFLTIWTADNMTELYKLASHGGFRAIEIAKHPVTNAVYKRLAWYRHWKEVR